MSEAKMKLGIIGTGDVADRWHAPNANIPYYSKLTAVLGRNEEKAKKFAEKHDIPNVHTNLDDLLGNKDIDAIIIATPDNTHIDIAKKVAKAGKHMLIEKPLGVNVKECVELKKVVEDNGVRAYVGYHLRQNTAHEIIRSELRESSVESISMHWTYDMKEVGWRNNSESPWLALGALTTHCIDLSAFLLRKKQPRIQDIEVLTTNTKHGKNEEEVYLNYTIGGTPISIFNSVLYKSESKLIVNATNKNYGKVSHIVDDSLGPRANSTYLYKGNISLDYRGYNHSWNLPVLTNGFTKTTGGFSPYREQIRELQKVVSAEKKCERLLQNKEYYQGEYDRANLRYEDAVERGINSHIYDLVRQDRWRDFLEVEYRYANYANNINNSIGYIKLATLDDAIWNMKVLEQVQEAMKD